MQTATNIYRASTKQFTWDSEDREFYADASDVEYDKFDGQPPDERMILYNPATGVEVELLQTKQILQKGQIHHTDGTIEHYTEIAGWEYQPVTSELRNRYNFKLTLINA